MRMSGQRWRLTAATVIKPLQLGSAQPAGLVNEQIAHSLTGCTAWVGSRQCAGHRQGRSVQRMVVQGTGAPGRG